MTSFKGVSHKRENVTTRNFTNCLLSAALWSLVWGGNLSAGLENWVEASEALNWGWMQWPVEEDSSLDWVESLEKVCSSVEQMGGLFSFLLLGYSQQECSTSSQADRPKLQDSPSAPAFSCGLQVHACGCTWSAEVAHLAADSHVRWRSLGLSPSPVA